MFRIFAFLLAAAMATPVFSCPPQAAQVNVQAQRAVTSQTNQAATAVQLKLSRRQQRQINRASRQATSVTVQSTGATNACLTSAAVTQQALVAPLAVPQASVSVQTNTQAAQQQLGPLPEEVAAQAAQQAAAQQAVSVHRFEASNPVEVTTTYRYLAAQPVIVTQPVLAAPVGAATTTVTSQTSGVVLGQRGRLLNRGRGSKVVVRARL